MEMKKQKKIIGGMILVLAVTACASFFKSAAEEIAQEETSEIYQNEIKTIYTEAYQDEVETQIEEEKSSGAYTEDNMLIKENPYGTNTLSLYVYFTTQEPVSVSYNVSVPDLSIGDFSQTPEGEGRFDTEHEFQVMGLIPEECNTITFTLTKEDGSVEIYSYVHEMGELSGKEEIQLKQTEAAEGSETVSDGLYVVLGNDSDEEDFMYYYDNSGVLRGEIPLIGYRSHRLLFRDDCMYYSISESKIAAVNHLGKAEKIYDTGTYSLHHDYVFDDDGNLLVLATDTESDSVEDQIIQINTQTGEVSCEEQATSETEAEISETSYEDGQISVTLTEYCEADTTVYVADILLSSSEYLKTAFAQNSYGKNVTEKTSEMAARENAVLAINGDYYGAQEKGYVLRSGKLYRSEAEKGQEDLVIYQDGTFEIISEEDIAAEELLEQGAQEILSFGPALIQEGDICVTEEDEVGKAMASNPRTAIGIIDSLHYVFVVSDGRTEESEGLSLLELAELMYELGVETAYNLDGGGSSTMYFNGKVVNKPTTSGKSIKERSVSDIVYIGY